jgi:dCMP deaminase
MIWQDHWMELCEVVAKKSPCLSRKIGAVIVKDNTLVSTGHNGPPRGMKHCDERLRLTSSHDPIVTKAIQIEKYINSGGEVDRVCPRRALGYESGEGLYLCPAVHAEVNAITNASRLGVSIVGAEMFLNSYCPCYNCLGAIINAGICRVYHTEHGYYDHTTSWIARESKIDIVRYVKGGGGR